MERQLQAFRAVVAGLLAGVAGNILFYGQVIGLSFPIFTAVVTLMVIGFASQRMNRRNLWIIAPMLFFALMVMVRADVNILLLDALAVMGLFFLLVRYITVKYPLDAEPVGEFVAAALDAGMSSAFRYAGGEYVKSAQWLHRQVGKDNAALVAVARGLLITLPVVAVFALLLASADLIFAGYFEDIIRLANTSFAEQLGWRVTLLGALGWMVTGSIAYALYANPSNAVYLVEGEAVQEIEAEDDKPKRKVRRFRLGIIESGMLLGSLIALFGVFVLLQFTYLFGGQANISVEGYTYADYARRGFFELLAVTMMMLALLLWLDSVTVVEGRREKHLLRGLASAVVVLMLVIVAAASQRMTLYEEAYGFTHLRVYSHVFIWWIGVLFIVFMLHLFRMKPNVFSLGVLLVMIGYLGTMNLLNVDHYIAEHNISRYHNGEELDVCYLNQLSLDALPAILKLYETETNPEIHDHLVYWLSYRQFQLEQDQNNTTAFSFNLARSEAWAELNKLELPIYWELTTSVSARCGYGSGAFWRG